MIKTSQINISYANTSKREILDRLFQESNRVINSYISSLWGQSKSGRLNKFIRYKIDSWLSARMLQCLGKYAIQIIKSQRKRIKKTRPSFTKDIIELDSRFVDVQFNNNTFDIWVRLSSVGQKIILKLPSKKHLHLLGLLNNGYNLKQSIRLRKTDGNYFIDLFLEKPSPPPKSIGETIGIDIGYKQLIAVSTGDVYGKELEQVYEKISRRKQGSKNFKQSLKERDNLTNKAINQIKFESAKTIIVEDLKNVRHKSKLSAKINNKLQRWVYSRVLDRISQKCLEYGVSLVKVSPRYTSQTCSQCGTIKKSNRKGTRYKCSTCGLVIDADTNASINILHRGAYSPSAIPERNKTL